MITGLPLQGIVNRGLVGYWDAGIKGSYPGSGTTWTNLNGVGTGTLLGGTGFTSLNGGALTLDGIDDYVTMGSVAPSQSETILVWIKSTPSTFDELGWFSSSRGADGHIIHPETGTKTVTFYLFNYLGQISLLTSYSVSDITKFHLYGFTTNGSNNHVIYVDGTQVRISSATILRSVSPSPLDWRVGNDTIPASPRCGNGNIGMVLRYNVQLSSQEISSIFQSTRKRFGV